jgi:hypothetical protein
MACVCPSPSEHHFVVLKGQEASRCCQSLSFPPNPGELITHFICAISVPCAIPVPYAIPVPHELDHLSHPVLWTIMCEKGNNIGTLGPTPKSEKHLWEFRSRSNLWLAAGLNMLRMKATAIKAEFSVR